MNALQPIEYDNRRVLLTAQLAELYGTTDRRISENYKRNADRYIYGIDFVCLESETLKEFKREYANCGIAENINKLYLWYEHGALLHAKSLGTDEAWRVYGQLVDTYFIAQEMQKQLTTAKAATPPPVSDASETRAKAMLMNAKNRAAKMLKDLFAGAGVKPEYQIMALQDFYGDDGPKLPAIALQGTKVTFDKSTIAKKLGLYSKAGLPHAQAVGAIISVLDIGENEREKVPYCNNGHDGFDWQYTDSVVEKICAWLDNYGRSPQLLICGKKYNVVYRDALVIGR